MYDDMKFKDISIECFDGMNNIWNIWIWITISKNYL